MAETRRRSSRLLAAENKSSAQDQKSKNSSDDESGRSGENDFEVRASDGVHKNDVSVDGRAKPLQQEKQESPMQRAAQRRSPGVAQKKRKTVPDTVAGESAQGVRSAAPGAAGPNPSSMAAAASGKPKSARGRGKPAPLESLHNLSLWDVITKYPGSVERVAKEWVDRYCQDKLVATSELMSMIVQAGGCDIGVSEDDVESGEMDDVIKRIVDIIVKEGGTEPFRDKKLRNLRSAYEAFWTTLIADMHAAGYLLDDYVCDSLINLLIGMSSTKVRGYRHAGTLTAGLLVTGWISAQQQLAEAISTARLQEEAAQKQKKGGADKKRLIESLQRQAETAQSQVRQLISLVESTFTAVFAVRFRDVGPEIRAVVIDLVGRWIRLMPATFMVDQYLKYVAWALSDRDAGVRAVAISRLLELFGGSLTAQPMAAGTRVEVPAHLPLLYGFIERFTVRFKELPYDINEEVAVLGVRLLTQLLAVGAITDVQLPAWDCYRLLIDNPLPIRRAAADLAAQLLHEDASKLEPRYAQWAKDAAEAAAAPAAAAAATPDVRNQVTSRRSTRLKAAAAASPAAISGGSTDVAAISLISDPEQRKKVTMLGALLEMMSLLRQGDLPGRPAADSNTESVIPLEPELVEDMVDALYERLPVLRSWKLIVDCMSDDLLAQIWRPLGLAHLAALLAAAMKRARRGAAPAGKGPASARRQGPRMRAIATDADVLLEASQVMLPALPGLLRRHQIDQNVVSSLTALIRDLNLELFSLRGDDGGWRTLLGLVGNQLAARGASPELLTQCADTLTFAVLSGPPALQPVARMIFRDVCGQLAAGLATAATAIRAMDCEDLASAVMDLAAGDNSADVEELLALRVALLRAHAVLIRGGPALASDPRVYETVDGLLTGCGSGRFLGPELTGLLAETQLLVLLNNLNQIHQNPGAFAEPVTGVPSPGDRSAGVLRPAIQKLQEARDALMGHMVVLHSAAAALGDAVLEPDAGGSGGNTQRVGTAHVAILQDMAFRVLSDLALVFGSKAWKNSSLEAVCSLTLSTQVADLMWRHCAEVLSGADTREIAEDEDEENEGLEESDDDLTAGPHGVSAKRAWRREAVSNKMAVVGCLGRLLAHNVCGDYYRTLAINLVAEFCNHGPEVADLIRDVCRELIASRPHGEMPQIYTGALRKSWASVSAAGELGDDEEHEALQRFADLAKHIATMYAGHDISRPELLHILRNLTAEALVDAPTNLAILAWGAASFVPKLAPADAATLVGEMESRLKGQGDAGVTSGTALPVHDREDPDWVPLYHYLTLLKGKASKGRVAPRALKGICATTPKAARNRKITFALSPKDLGHGRVAEQEAKDEAAASAPENGHAAPEDGTWLHRAMGDIRKPGPGGNEDDEEDEETMKPAPKHQPNRQQIAGVAAGPLVERDGAMPTGSKSAASVGAGLRAADVEAGPLDSLAHSGSTVVCQGLTMESPQQHSLRAISDVHLRGSEERLDQEEDAGAYNDEPSDLRAITESHVKTASGAPNSSDEVEDDRPTRNVDKDHNRHEAIERNGERTGNPAVPPTEEELPGPLVRHMLSIYGEAAGRRAKVPGPRRGDVAAAPSPSVSRLPFKMRHSDADRSNVAGSLVTSQGTLNTREGSDGSSGHGEAEAEEEELDLQASQVVSSGINLIASEGVDEGEDEAQAAAGVQRMHGRKRRLTIVSDLVASLEGEATGGMGNGGSSSDQLQPLPSITADVPQTSLQADSVADTQCQVEPPRRNVKRRRI